MRKIFFILLAIVLQMSIACTETEGSGKDELSVSPKLLYFTCAETNAKTVSVTTDLDNWVATPDAGWIKVEKASGGKTFSVTVDANRLEEERFGKIVVRAGTQSASISVIQEQWEIPETIKILAIGNSFSDDVVEQELHGLFAGVGQKVIIGDAYVAGCPLKKHNTNAKSDAATYSYRKIVDGVKKTTASTKLSTIMADEDWTYISLQEGAGYHGFYNTTYKGTYHSMEPDLTDMINYVKAKCPNAKLIYHAPWAAQKDYKEVKFSYYGYDQDVMYKMIISATQEVLKAHPEFVIYMNVMDAIQNLRSSYIGDNVTRDGWHLNYTVGRYTASCLWYEKIMGQSVVGNPYRPTTISESEAKLCQTAAHEAVKNPYTTTDLSNFEKTK